MTVKELAQFCGYSERNIQYWSKKARSGNSELAKKLTKTISSAGHGKAVNFSLDEVELILNNSSIPKNVVTILMQNARQNTVSISKKIEDTDTLKEAFLIMAKSFDRLTAIQENLNSRVTSIESKFEERKALLPPPQLKPRDHIRKLVSEYATVHSLEFADVWRKLYSEYNYRTHHNVNIAAKNRGMSVFDYIDVELFDIETLESIAIEIFTN